MNTVLDLVELLVITLIAYCFLNLVFESYFAARERFLVRIVQQLDIRDVVEHEQD